jgi:hypothetical protein
MRAMERREEFAAAAAVVVTETSKHDRLFVREE